jgi:formylglycine-generating enzyme required for sulfatase activity
MTSQPKPPDPVHTLRNVAGLGVVAMVGFLAAYGAASWWNQDAGRNRIRQPAPVQTVERAPESTEGEGFEPTIENSTKAPGPAPEGMVWIPGGEFSMGCEDPRHCPCGGPDPMPDARPIHRVYVDGFWMDTTEVTNEQFAAFVEATGYVTIAEKVPSADDFPPGYPKPPPENLVAGSTVFTPSEGAVPLDVHYRWWAYVKGANWRHPLGPESDLTGKENYPVVQIAYDDALAYCQWAGKRLPTEAEWEFAARGGKAGERYTWGNELQPGGKWMANIYQGEFPIQGGDTGADGFMGIALVAKFPANPYGLYDMAGNVWEWCSDWYRPDYYASLAANVRVARNPQGPTESYDPGEPAEKKRVHRGGSFLCTDKYCTRYIVGTRGRGEPMTGSNHAGFRCVREPE